MIWASTVAAAQVGGADHLIEGPQRVVLLRRFLGEDVERRAGDPAGDQRPVEGALVDQPAHGAVDDPAAGLDPGQGLLAEHAVGFSVERYVDGDEIGACQQLLELDRFGAGLADHLLGQVGIVNDDPHLQPQRPLHHQAADLAGADHAKGLAGDLNAEKTVLFPASGLGRAAGLGDLPGQRHEHGDGMFGGGGGAAEGGIHHHHPLAVGGGKIHVLDADSGAADDLEPAGCREDLGGHLGSAAHHQGLGIGDLAQQLGGRKARVIGQLDSLGLLENGESLGGESIGNEYLHRLPVASSKARNCRDFGLLTNAVR